MRLLRTLKPLCVDAGVTYEAMNQLKLHVALLAPVSPILPQVSREQQADTKAGEAPRTSMTSSLLMHKWTRPVAGGADSHEIHPVHNILFVSCVNDSNECKMGAPSTERR